MATNDNNNVLSGIILPLSIERESAAPSKQVKLTKEERYSKEKVTFDDAMEKCFQYCQRLKFDGNDIHTSVIKCKEDDLQFNDYEYLQDFLKTSIKQLHEFSDLSKEYKDVSAD